MYSVTLEKNVSSKMLHHMINTQKPRISGRSEAIVYASSFRYVIMWGYYMCHIILPFQVFILTNIMQNFGRMWPLSFLVEDE